MHATVPTHRIQLPSSALPQQAQRHGRIDGVFAEAGQFLVEGRTKGVSVHTGHCTRIEVVGSLRD
jgi:hypothetical protein